eukprot:gene12222-biopygen3455
MAGRPPCLPQSRTPFPSFRPPARSPDAFPWIPRTDSTFVHSPEGRRSARRAVQSAPGLPDPPARQSAEHAYPRRAKAPGGPSPPALSRCMAAARSNRCPCVAGGCRYCTPRRRSRSDAPTRAGPPPARVGVMSGGAVPLEHRLGRQGASNISHPPIRGGSRSRVGVSEDAMGPRRAGIGLGLGGREAQRAADPARGSKGLPNPANAAGIISRRPWEGGRRPKHVGSATVPCPLGTGGMRNKPGDSMTAPRGNALIPDSFPNERNADIWGRSGGCQLLLAASAAAVASVAWPHPPLGPREAIAAAARPCLWARTGASCCPGVVGSQARNTSGTRVVSLVSPQRRAPRQSSR